MFRHNKENWDFLFEQHVA